MKTTDFAKTVNKNFGAGTIVRLGDTYTDKIQVIPTGSIALDAATGVGGFPLGKISVLIGDPMSGKTTLALHAVSEVQKTEGQVLYIDAEHSLDVRYAKAIGVDIDNLWINQPDYGEQALRIVEEALRSQEFKLVVVDSVAALVPKRELDGEVGDAQVGLQARMMSQACRKFVAAAHASGTALIFINQYRANIATTGFGGPTKIATGGKALDYFASMIMSVSRIQSLKDDGVTVANRTKVELRKNKLSAPYRSAEFDILFGVGIDKIGELVDLFEQYKIIERAGSFYREDGTSIARGRAGMVQFLLDNPEKTSKWRDDLMSMITGVQKTESES